MRLHGGWDLDIVFLPPLVDFSANLQAIVRDLLREVAALDPISATMGSLARKF